MIKKLKPERLFLTLLIVSMIMHVVIGVKVSALVDKFETDIKKQSMQLNEKDLQLELQDILLDMQDELIQRYIIDEQTADPVMQERKYIGEFEITYYTAGPESTGKSPGHPQYGITRSGTKVKEGHTIAADWTVLPAGTKVFIEGIGERVVEDTGGLIVDKCIDVYIERLEDIPSVGRHKADVWIVEDDNGTNI